MRLITLISLLVAVTILCTSAKHLRRRNPEKKLFEQVIRGYGDPGSRPVLDADSVVNVNFSLTLNRIMDLAEKDRMLITHVWVFEKWSDERIHWEPEKHGGVESLIVPPQSIWLPDLYIFNNADRGGDGFVVVNESRLSVHSDGTVDWILPLIIKSSCYVDVTYFPFDNQVCFVRFGSWIYAEEQLNLVLAEQAVDMDSFETNSEFDLISTKLERETKKYDTFSGSYPQITMFLHIKRKPLYYSYTVIAPTLVLCILNIFCFILPCDSGEKVGIGLTVFLSLYVLQLSVAENIPESNSLPLIGVFMTMVMTLNAASLVFATLVINIKKKGDRKPCPQVPKILLALCVHVLGRLTCTYTGSYYDFYTECGEDTDKDQLQDRSPDEEGTASEETDGEMSARRTSVCKMRYNHRHFAGAEEPEIDRSETRYLCRRRRKKMAKEAAKTDVGARDNRLDWFYVAEVLDKTLFLIFLLATVAAVSTTLVILPWLNDVG